MNQLIIEKHKAHIIILYSKGLFRDFDPQIPPNRGWEGDKNITKKFGQQYQFNDPKIIELYENPLVPFYWLLCIFHVKLTVMKSFEMGNCVIWSFWVI